MLPKPSPSGARVKSSSRKPPAPLLPPRSAGKASASDAKAPPQRRTPAFRELHPSLVLYGKYVASIFHPEEQFRSTIVTQSRARHRIAPKTAGALLRLL